MFHVIIKDSNFKKKIVKRTRRKRKITFCFETWFQTNTWGLHLTIMFSNCIALVFRDKED